MPDFQITITFNNNKISELAKKISRRFSKIRNVYTRSEELEHKKLPFELEDNDFTLAMCENFEQAIKDNDDFMQNDWKNIEWDSFMEGYYLARVRSHSLKFRRASSISEKKRHLAAIACNANIIWHHTGIGECEND